MEPPTTRVETLHLMERDGTATIGPLPTTTLAQEGGTWSCIGECGSTWSTARDRREKGWADADVEPTNFCALDPAQPSEWLATVKVNPRLGGEQAGLYAHTPVASWVKLVVEGSDDGGVFLVFAEQHGGKPFVRAKLPLPDFHGVVALRLAVCDGNSVQGFYRLDKAQAWIPVVRGLGWLESSELLEGVAQGRLGEGDPRGGTVAQCKLPDNWRAVLLTEQWRNSSDTHVSFSGVTAT